MINQSYRLHAPKQFRIDIIDEKYNKDDIIVRPTYLSICAADQRYYTGRRDPEVLKKKLPMALIHEAVGEVIYDPKKELKKGAKVVLIPNTPTEKDDIIKENYLRSSKFKSSGIDGFMQSFVVINRNRVIEYNDISDRIAVLLELLSVAMNALDHFEKLSYTKKNTLGVWGCGSVGLSMALVLRYKFPNAKLVVFNKSRSKLDNVPFADEVYTTTDIPKSLTVDHAFECVGGPTSADAVNQIIDIINPEGTISLLGVNEEPVGINTRMILEKGLNLIGNSRSSYEDFNNAIKFLKETPKTFEYLNNIISEEITVKDIKDISKSFDASLNNEYKTIMKWEI